MRGKGNKYKKFELRGEDGKVEKEWGQYIGEVTTDRGNELTQENGTQERPV